MLRKIICVVLIVTIFSTSIRLDIVAQEIGESLNQQIILQDELLDDDLSATIYGPIGAEVRFEINSGQNDYRLYVNNDLVDITSSTGTFILNNSIVNIRFEQINDAPLDFEFTVLEKEITYDAYIKDNKLYVENVDEDKYKNVVFYVNSSDDITFSSTNYSLEQLKTGVKFSSNGFSDDSFIKISGYYDTELYQNLYIPEHYVDLPATNKEPESTTYASTSTFNSNKATYADEVNLGDNDFDSYFVLNGHSCYYTQPEDPLSTDMLTDCNKNYFTDKGILLTEDKQGQRGYVASTLTIDSTKDFDLSFDLYMLDRSAKNSADGFSVNIYSDYLNAFGSPGKYSGGENIRNNVFLRYNPYYKEQVVQVHKTDEEGNVSDVSTPYTVRRMVGEGAEREVNIKVHYDSTNHELRYRVDDDTYSRFPVIVVPDPFEQGAPIHISVGGTTGAESVEQRIYNFQFKGEFVDQLDNSLTDEDVEGNSVSNDNIYAVGETYTYDWKWTNVDDTVKVTTSIEDSATDNGGDALLEWNNGTGSGSTHTQVLETGETQSVQFKAQSYTMDQQLSTTNYLDRNLYNKLYLTEDLNGYSYYKYTPNVNMLYESVNRNYNSKTFNFEDQYLLIPNVPISDVSINSKDSVNFALGGPTPTKADVIEKFDLMVDDPFYTASNVTITQEDIKTADNLQIDYSSIDMNNEGTYDVKVKYTNIFGETTDEIILKANVVEMYDFEHEIELTDNNDDLLSVNEKVTLNGTFSNTGSFDLYDHQIEIVLDETKLDLLTLTDFEITDNGNNDVSISQSLNDNILTLTFNGVINKFSTIHFSGTVNAKSRFTNNSPLVITSTSNYADVNSTFTAKMEIDLSQKPVLTANDSEVKLSDAPTDENMLIKLHDATAYDVDGTDITKNISVIDYDSYDINNPQVGTYTIVFSVLSSIETEATFSVNLTVKSDEENVVSQALIFGNTPIAINKGDGTTSEEIESFISPMLMTYENDQSEVTNDVQLISNDNYNNDEIGTYFFTYISEYNGLKITKSFPVNVTSSDSNTVTGSVISIDADDVEIVVGSVFDPFVTLKPEFHSNNGEIVSTEVFYTNVNTNIAGQYSVIYKAVDNFGSVGYKDINVTVKEIDKSNAKLFANDVTVHLSDAPTNESELLELLNVFAYDYDNTNITDKVYIQSISSYDYENVEEGKYDILLNVVGNNGVIVQTKSMLTVVSDTEPIKHTKIIGNNPITVVQNDGTTIEDAIKLMDINVVGLVDGTIKSYSQNYSVVSDGNYNNSEVGRYNVVVKASSSTRSNRNSQNTYESFVINVVAEGEETTSNVNVAAEDMINISKGSNVDILDYLSYEATSTVDGDVTDNVEVFDSNVNSSKVGSYFVILSATDSVDSVGYKVVNVNVVEYDSSINGTIVASDRKIRKDNTTVSNSDIINMMQVKALNPDGSKITNDVHINNITNLNTNLPVKDYSTLLNNEGTYSIEFGVVDSTNTYIYTNAKLEVTNYDSHATIIGNNPVYVKQNDGTTVSDITNIISPKISVNNGTILNNANIKLISDDGYENSIEGVYIFEYQADINGQVIRSSFTVYVDSENDTGVGVEISANSPLNVVEGSSFDPIETPNVKAISENDGDITSEITYISNVNIEVPGKYFVLYEVEDSKLNSAYKQIEVNVIENINTITSGLDDSSMPFISKTGYNINYVLIILLIVLIIFLLILLRYRKDNKE